MSLTKQTVAVPLIDGLSDNDDNFASDPPGWIEIAEARWSRDKVIGKRNGVVQDVDAANNFLVSTATGPNAMVDLDGIPHVLSADGTFRRNAVTGAWEKSSLGAPLPGRLVSDPVVRVNQTAVKSDVAVCGTVACVVWEVLSAASTTPTGYAGFWDISQDVPRPLTPPISFGSGYNSLRVTSLSSRYFIVTAIDAPTGTRHLKAYSYDIGAGTWTFTAPVTVDTLNSVNSYDLCSSYDQTSFAVVAYLTGGNLKMAKLSVVPAVTSVTTLGGSFGSPQQVVHNGPISKLVCIDQAGNVYRIADTLSGGATLTSPFTNPASGIYTGNFHRGAIGLLSSTGTMVAMRSSSGAGGLGSGYATQLLTLNTSFAVITTQLMGGVVITGLCSPLVAAVGTCYFGLGLQGAHYTGDRDPSVAGHPDVAYKANPASFLCRAFTDSTAFSGLTEVEVLGRYGQDAIDLSGNADVGSPLFNANTAHCPHIAYDSIGTTPHLVTAYPTLQADQLGGGTSSFKRGVDLAQCWPVNTTPARNVSAQSLRVIGAGHGVSDLDGNSHSEMSLPAPEWLQFDGFDSASTGNSYPFTGSIPPNVQGHIDFTNYNVTWGPLVPPGTLPNPNRQWGFVVVRRYVDARGNIHRSAPSSIYWTLIAELVDASGHAGKLAFPAHNPTALLGDRGATVEAEIYGCPVDGQGDFRMLGIVTPHLDATDEGLVYAAITRNGTNLPYSVDLATWDANSLLGGIVPRSLYTTSFGGTELAASVAPALLSICSTQSRLWGLSGEDRLDVWFTKPMVLGYAPEWSDTLRVRIPQEGGPSVAIAALDDKVVVFKRSKVFVIEGDGGDSSGNNSSLRPPRLVSSDVGCDTVESVIEGPFGIIFHSERGFMLLSRDLSYRFIGDRVMDQMTAASRDGQARSVSSACIIPSETEVRFALKTSGASTADVGLAWNYRLDRWTRRDGLAPIFSANVGGVEWSAVYEAGTSIYYETPFAWTLAPYQVRALSSWIKLNGIAGFGRLWRAVFLFRWYSGPIAIACGVDYQSDPDSTRLWDATALAGLVDGSGRVELSVKPVTQKCEAVQFTVGGFGDDAKLSGRGFDLIGVSLEVGVKKGAFKRLPAAARK